jgi:acyl-coenzyme A synthetase/AMP-(fatty) acid ligase/acyl carrier protein
LVNAWLALYPSTKVANAYGPTEAADDVAQWIIEQPLADDQGMVPIGKPLPNLSLYIVDDHLQLVPAGVPGEICVAGIGVGNGYWSDEEKTRLHFVPNPFPDAPGKVLYRTGDRGRWLPDGTIEFLGRIDHQVKIRGFRVELEEVDAALRRIPDVNEAAAVVRSDQRGDSHLIAYLASDRGASLDSDCIRQRANELLPTHMVPSLFVLVEALPRTASGKVDRNALPDVSAFEPEGTYVEPRNPLENELAAIWARALEVERVGIRDNFFDLGGHSLLAAQIVARVQETFGVKLPLRRFFEAPTVAAAARMIAAIRGAA